MVLYGGVVYPTPGIYNMKFAHSRLPLLHTISDILARMAMLASLYVAPSVDGDCEVQLYVLSG